MKPTIEQVAHHEAAHAVVLYLECDPDRGRFKLDRWPFREVWIKERETGWTGEVETNLENLKLQPEQGNAVSRGFLVGHVADRVFFPDEPATYHGDDFNSVKEMLAERHLGKPSEQFRELAELCAETEKLLANATIRRMIVAVAEAIQQKQKLNYDEVRSIVYDVLSMET